MADKRVQLWTDDTYNDFAIVLKPYILARTDEKTKYTKVVDESDQGDRYSYDWKYTLSQWVNYHFGNQVLVNISETTSILTPEPQKQKIIKNQKGMKYYLLRSKPTSPIIDSTLELKPKGLKCHFCNLKYCLDDERKQHEEIWHSNKLTPL